MNIITFHKDLLIDITAQAHKPIYSVHLICN